MIFASAVQRVENKRLRDENKALKDDNAKLFSLLKHESKQNEKLRKLVRDMWLELDALVPYDPYDHDGLDEYRDRMRELGVDE